MTTVSDFEVSTSFNEDNPAIDLCAVEDFDSMYDEIFTGLFGGIKHIKVGDVVISKESLKTLYYPLKVNAAVLKILLTAHNDVLEYGVSSGNERVVVVDKESGRIVDDQTGTPTSVSFYVPPKYKGEIITIHNHPSSYTFSPKDLYTLNDVGQIRCSVVQGHDGSLHYLEKVRKVKYNLPETHFQVSLDNILKNPEHKAKTFEEKLKVFVELSAEQLNLIYVRR